MNIFCVSKSELCLVKNGRAEKLNSQVIDKYRRTVRDIENRKSWKTSGSGAMFMGTAAFGSEADSTPAVVSGLTLLGDGDLCYSAVIGENSSVQIKPSVNMDDPEGTILRKNNTAIYDVQSNPENTVLIASCGDGMLRHIGIIDRKTSGLRMITEGDSIDRNPFFVDDSIVYYDSCGVAYRENGVIAGLGPREIIRLNLSTGDLTELVSDARYDYFKPKEHEGKLYYIRRPYKPHAEEKMSIIDILLMPFKVLKAIGGWLDFFTRRYTGESLKTTGQNPAKQQQKSDEQLFIEGNLINSEKTLAENRRRGEKYPGKAPGTWQLMVREPGTDVDRPVKTGILDYCFYQDGIIVSNGRYITRLQNNAEEMVCECELAMNLTVVEVSGKKAEN